MAERFRHEDVEAVPKGWKVRTVKAGAHRVRVAFPPGRKQKGSGRLVSVLHPLSGHNPCANPCTLRSANPAELMVMGANPPRRRNAEAKKQREVEKIRESLLKLADKAEKKGFKGLAEEYRQSARKNPAELMVMGANPRVEVVHGDNPPVEEIVERFSGTSADYIDVYNEPHMPRGRYAQLGELLNLYIKPAKGGQVQKITFAAGSEAPMVVTDSTARQIYFVAGNQDISGALDVFGFGAGSMDGVLELGAGRRIDYKARKEHVAEPDEDKWKHEHGEENGVLPTVLFDTRNKRLLYEGGDYRIEGAWIRN
jgi:nucleotide-binding universal stress UspA family protein